MPALRASLFGAFRLQTEGEELPVPSRRARALLAALSLCPGEPVERDDLSRMLWPGRFQAQARASLRQELLGLDRMLTPVAGKVLVSSHGRIAIDPARFGSDFAELEEALARGRVSDACGLLADIGDRPLVEPMNLGAPFEHWLGTRRSLPRGGCGMPSSARWPRSRTRPRPPDSPTRGKRAPGPSARPTIAP